MFLILDSPVSKSECKYFIRISSGSNFKRYPQCVPSVNGFKANVEIYLKNNAFTNEQNVTCVGDCKLRFKRKTTRLFYML